LLGDLAILVTVIVAGYLLGSVACAIVVCHALRRPDPREGGSTNPGATNVLRTGGRDAAALTLLGDGAKGAAAVALARLFSDDPVIWALAGAAAFFGHIFPVFFRFRGGKGVATALGALATTLPAAGALTAATWVIVIGVARVSAIASLTAFALAPVYVGLLSRDLGLVAVTLVVSLALITRHRSNIRKLFASSSA
jgi:glycerol-3-phosphate acyltransferase PlsY